MITLAIDTSTTRGSVALLSGDTLLLHEDFVADRSHTASLFTVLERARAATEQIDQVAIGLGPGSYAGVRIAISAALGFRLGLGARLVGIPSVAVLETSDAEYNVIGDARRESYYFTKVREGICVDGPLLATAAELRDRLAQSSDPLFSTATIPHFPSAQLAFPSATSLARLAAAGRGIIASDDLEPIYLREAHITQPRTDTRPLR